jgi:hypothetical protein
MLKLSLLCLLVCLLIHPYIGHTESFYSSGTIDNDLSYEGFDVGDDGFLRGVIINTSNKTQKDLKIDVWTTDTHETRIFWRKTLVIGDLGPGAKYTLKEPYKKTSNPDGITIKYSFRIHNPKYGK